MNRQQLQTNLLGMWVISLFMGVFATVALALEFEEYPLDTLDKTTAQGVKPKWSITMARKGYMWRCHLNISQLSKGGVITVHI